MVANGGHKDGEPRNKRGRPLRPRHRPRDSPPTPGRLPPDIHDVTGPSPPLLPFWVRGGGRPGALIWLGWARVL